MMELNWSERIRPKSVSDIVGNKEFVNDFKSWIESGHYPSALLLAGPSGTGKTSAGNAIVHTMLGEWNNDMNVLWTNASDDRGIAYLRENIKTFARLSGVGVSRKVIFLDEADGLTSSSQDALRGIMEKYAKRVLFILTVNHIGKISSAIKSRCKVYYFKRLSPKDGAEHLKLLTESCGAPIEWEQDYEYLVEHTNGDLRDAINHLEAIPKKPNALTLFRNKSITSDEDFWDSINKGKYTYLTDALIDISIEKGLPYMMNQFHRIVKKHIDTSTDVVFASFLVWGEMFEVVHQWHGSDEMFVHVMVAKLKKEIEAIK